jgi:hypothetical protein
MPPPPKYRKRRQAQGPNKNELKVSRGESQQKQKAQAGTLRERFPDAKRLHVEMRMEAAAGPVLDESVREIDFDDPLLFDVQCQGGCSNGVFLLTDVIAAVLSAHQDSREGMGICQASSFRDPSLPCGTKFYYRIVAEY